LKKNKKHVENGEKCAIYANNGNKVQFLGRWGVCVNEQA
jgi:hypothetical protein